MSTSSAVSELDKEDDAVRLEKNAETAQQPSTTNQEEVREACQPPFTVNDDLEKSTSKGPTEQATGNSLQSVPNGGLRAWLQVLGSFFMFFNTWGIINAFGIYQTYYQKGELFQSTASNISWIGSIQGFLLMVISSFAGPVYDAGYVRQLVAGGSFLVVLGMMMLSLCTAYWQVFLAQGICVGLGTGCLFVTGVAILSTYFSTRIATATGIAATGSSIGGMLYPIIFSKLQPQIGFAWATRVLGFLALGTLLIANLATKVRTVPASRRKFIDMSAWKELPYTFVCLGLFLSFCGLYAVFFYVEAYALETGVMGPHLAFYLLTILNAASTFGRFIPNFLADRMGPMNMILPCVFFTSVVCFCLIAARSTVTLIICVAFFGFFSGSIVSLPPSIFVHLSKNHRHLIGTRMGMAFAVTACGLVIGAPVAGVILRASNFTNVWIYAGVFNMLAGISVAIARVLQVGWRPMVVV